MKWTVVREYGLWYVVSRGYVPVGPGTMGRGVIVLRPHATRQVARNEARLMNA